MSIVIIQISNASQISKKKGKKIIIFKKWWEKKEKRKEKKEKFGMKLRNIEKMVEIG